MLAARYMPLLMHHLRPSHTRGVKMSDEKEDVISKLQQLKDDIGQYSDSTIRAFIDEIIKDIEEGMV